jgi:hypothetical protein
LWYDIDMFLVDKDPLDKFVSDLRSRLVGESNNTKEFVTRGACKDFTEYREKIGVLRGINTAIEQLDELVKLDGAD